MKPLEAPARAVRRAPIGHGLRQRGLPSLFDEGGGQSLWSGRPSFESALLFPARRGGTPQLLCQGEERSPHRTPPSPLPDGAIRKEPSCPERRSCAASETVPDSPAG